MTALGHIVTAFLTVGVSGNGCSIGSYHLLLLMLALDCDMVRAITRPHEGLQIKTAVSWARKRCMYWSVGGH